MTPDTPHAPLDVGSYIQSAWSNLLKQSNMGQTSELGTASMSSLMLAQLCLEVEQAFQAPLPLDVVFESKTIEHLIANLKIIDWPRTLDRDH